MLHADSCARPVREALRAGLVQESLRLERGENAQLQVKVEEAQARTAEVEQNLAQQTQISDRRSNECYFQCVRITSPTHCVQLSMSSLRLRCAVTEPGWLGTAVRVTNLAR